MDVTPLKRKYARPGERLKEGLKETYCLAVNLLSHSLSDAALFRGALLLRRFGLGLKRASMPAPFQVTADFLFYSLRNLRPGLVEVQHDGLRFFIPLNDPCQYDLLLGSHEPEVLQWIVSELKQGMTFFDVGANVGYYTWVASRCVGNLGRVVALEPDPEVAAILRRTIQANSINNVHVVQGAAYRTCGIVKFGRASSTSVASGLFCANASEWIEVPGHSLDTLAAGLKIAAVDMIKLDVEGAELESIQGMTQILKEHRPKLLMELHGNVDTADSFPPIRELKNLGYAISVISGNHVVAMPILQDQ